MDLERVLTCLVEETRYVSQADVVVVRLLDTRASIDASSGLPDDLRSDESLSLGQPSWVEDALAGQPVVIDDASVDGCRSAVCLPLACQDDTFGTLCAYAASPHHFDDDVITRLASLTDLGSAAIASSRSLEALKEVDTSRAHFIRVATHELRSPVAVAQSLVRGVLKGYAGELSDQHAKIFGRISRRLDFLESLINDLLDLAAGQASDAEDEEPVAVNASVGRAVLFLQPRAEEKGVDLTHRACCEELVIWGNEDGLDRIFVNLIGNAVKYTPSGGSVTVSLGRVGDEIQVTVTDTGIGIPEDALPRLFDEFYRAPNAKALEEVGTGLGLTIVKDLVDKYGGRIDVESTVGEGSVFTVAFPVLVDW